MRAGCLALLAALLFATPASAAVTMRRGIVYGHGQRLDLYMPATRSAARAPVVVLIHGGGFAIANRTEPGLTRVARALADEGIVAASIDYRLLGSNPRPSARVRPLLAGLPDGREGRAIASAVDDTLTAIGYLKAHARPLGIDPSRLGLIGSSAGAMTANHVAYVLDDYGIKPPTIRFVGDLWGAILVASPVTGLSAATQLERGEPPLFAVHGAADPLVPVTLDDQLAARAREQGVPAEYLRIRGAAHGFEGSKFFTADVGGGSTPFERLLAFAAFYGMRTTSEAEQ